MIVDFDDLYEGHDRLDLLLRLKEANPAFRVTAFCVTAKCSEEYLATLPEWIECVPHGWLHETPTECASWDRSTMLQAMLMKPERMVRGWKSPGWQVSDGTYEALANHGWWIADHWQNNWRRPKGLQAHVISRAAANGGDPEHWHGHIGNVCGNGIEETFGVLLQRVRDADSFQFISEVVT